MAHVYIRRSQKCQTVMCYVQEIGYKPYVRVFDRCKQCFSTQASPRANVTKQKQLKTDFLELQCTQSYL